MCEPRCGIYLHKCQRCGFESGPIVHTDECPGCAYLAAKTCTCPLGPEDAHFPDCPMFLCARVGMHNCDGIWRNHDRADEG